MIGFHVMITFYGWCVLYRVYGLLLLSLFTADAQCGYLFTFFFSNAKALFAVNSNDSIAEFYYTFCKRKIIRSAKIQWTVLLMYIMML